MKKTLLTITTLALLLNPTYLFLSPVSAQEENSWPMAGANPQRTSWTPEEVKGNLSPVWYRPIEPYISQNVQIIAADGKLFISTARGLYALNAANGDIAWVYPTELPLGHSPTYHEGVLYVGGFDRKLHAIDATTGSRLWTFDEAKAGYRTNPLVINNLVLLGNRDGWFYAIHAHGTPNQGTLAWKYQTDGPILYSAAYKKDAEDNDVIFFASQDMHSYALYATTGQLKWKSEKLPGGGFNSWWPVIWDKHDKVVLVTSPNYRQYMDPGPKSCDEIYPPEYWCAGCPVDSIGGLAYTWIKSSGLEFIEGNEPGDWIEGTKTWDATPYAQYYEEKSWRRSVYLLEAETGQDWGFDYDGDGNIEYAPFSGPHTNGNGIDPPPMISGFDNVLYQQTCNGSPSNCHIAGWTISRPFVSQITTDYGAGDEPRIASGGGSVVYHSLCSDREAGGIDISMPLGYPEPRKWRYYMYNLPGIAPGYDPMWKIGYEVGPENRLVGYYASWNGIYHNNGADQNPWVPYNGHLYIHRSNAILCFGPAGGAQKLPLAEIQQPPEESYRAFSTAELKQMLADEIQKWLDAGHLHPGWFNGGQFNGPLNDYFQNPAENIWTLLRALPHLPPDLQQTTRDFIQSEYQAYDPTTYAITGWSEGSTRDWFLYPPEVEADLVNFPPSEDTSQGGSMWIGWKRSFPPMNFYTLWKYAQEFGNAEEIYNTVKNKLTSPNYDSTKPQCLNAYIAGYWGYLELERLAGQPESTSVRDTLNQMLQFRVDNFTKDTPFWGPTYSSHANRVNISRNFIYLTPELGQYLHEHALSKVQEAVDEYNYVGPYWFVSRYEGCLQESTIQNLHDTYALFQAKAWILQDPQEELLKYLDVPGFMQGDLFYIHNLISAIEAQPTTEPQPQPTLTGDLNEDNIVNILDLVIVGNSFGKEPGETGYDSRADSNNSGGVIDIFDLILVGSNFGRSI